MLGTWRTNDAEKNHTHKIRKKEKKEGKRKRNPMMDGMGLENGMAFCVGRNRNRNRKGKHTKEGRNYLIRYEGVGVGVGVARVNTFNLT